jgi:ACT domain-containing protein
VSRRFLTAEDVRRLGGPEIRVDAATVVTPQALDAARAAGIAITTAEGEWREPRPDRGPDTDDALRTLPHLPEPADEEDLASSAVVTAVGRNRAGVLAEITRTIAELGGNVHDVSQRVIEGYFYMILTVELPAELDFARLKTCLECLGSPDDFAVQVMHERVFRFMHRV